MPIKRPEPGDDLLHIAQREGVARADIVNHPENRQLFARRNGAVLHQDDEIFVPEPEPATFTIATGHTHYFVYKPPTRTLHLELRGLTGELRQTDYTLQEFVFDQVRPKYERPLPEKLYGFAYQGIIHEELPAALKRATLLLEDDLEHPILLELGRLDPVSCLRGLKARLHNLGLYAGPLDDEFDPRLFDALLAFQLSEALPATGQPDPQTCERLMRSHGA